MTSPITLNVAQALVFAKTASTPIIIQDSNANIAASADALVALGSQILALQGDQGVFNPALNAADLLALSGKTFVGGGLEIFTGVNDTAAHAAAKTPALESYAARLLQYSTGLNIALNDSAANVASNTAALQTLAAGLVTDVYGAGDGNSGSYSNNNSLSLTIKDSAANFAANAAALQTLAARLSNDYYSSGYDTGGANRYYLNNNTLSLTVNDTAANVAANATALQALAAGLANDVYYGLAAASGNQNSTNNTTLTIAINDTAAHVLANSNALQTLAAGLSQAIYGDNSDLNNSTLAITVTDTAAHIAAKATATALETLAAGLALDTYAGGNSNNNFLTISITDTVANVAANASALLDVAATLTGDGYNNALNLNISDTAAHVIANKAALLSWATALTTDNVNTGNSNDNLNVSIIDSAASIVANAAALNALPIPAQIKLVDTAAHVQSALTGLQPVSAAITAITLTDKGTPAIALAASQFALDAAILAKIGSPYALILTDKGTPTLALSASQFVQDAAVLSKIVTPFQLALTDKGTPTLALTASQFSQDSGLLGKISTPYGVTISGELAANVSTDVKNSHVTAIGVVDTSTDVVAFLDTTLAANAAKIGGITLTDAGILNVSGSQFANDAAVFGLISTPYSVVISGELAANVANDGLNSAVTSIAVVDSAAAVQAALDSLESNAALLTGITLTDGGTPVLSITASQFVNDVDALGKLSTPYRLAISGETVANVAADSQTSTVSSIGVLDSAANVLAGLDGLQSTAALISDISLNDGGTPALAITAGQFVSDAAVLGKISSPYSLAISGETVANVAIDSRNSTVGSIGVVDSAAAVQAGIDKLESNVALISDISLTDAGTPTLTISASQFVSDAAVLAAISTPYNLVITGELAANVAVDSQNTAVTSISVVDSASNVQLNLDNLESNFGLIGSIALTQADSGTSVLSITASQFVSDVDVLAEIVTPHSLVISGELAANVAVDSQNSTVSRIGVVDSAADVQASLDSLESNAALLSGIVLTDGGTPVLALTASQFVSDVDALGAINTPYSLAISGEIAANVAIDSQNSHVGSISVVDTAANVQANMDSLAASAALVSNISLTDPGIPALTLSASQFNNDAAVLAAISTPFSVVISGELAANVATDSQNSIVSSIGVADSAANVLASLDSLEGNAAFLTGITLTDGGTPLLSITASQFVTDVDALGKISSPYRLAISGETVSNVAIDSQNSTVGSISVLDSAAAVQTGLDGLAGNAALIGGITLTDGGTPLLAVSASQFSSDAAVLGKINSPYALAISGEVAANVAADAKNSHVSSLALVDSAANVQATLDSLAGNVGKLGSITLTDQITPSLTISAGQYGKDAAVFGKVGSAYSLAISGELAANVVTDVKNSHVSSISVVDSAAAVQAAFNSLAGNVALISGITFTDQSPSLAINSSQFVPDVSLLTKIGSSYKLALSDKGTPTIALTTSQFLADAGLLSRIVTPFKLALTDQGTPALALTASQFSQDAALLARISTPYSLGISGETVANVTTDLNNSHVGSVAVLDSAAHVVASLDSLESSVQKLSGISLTDSGTPTLAVTASQFSKDAEVFAKIGTAYSVAISGEAAANVGSDLKNSHVASLGVVDSAANVQTALDSLEANAARISSIALTDSTTPSLSINAALFGKYVDVFSKVTSAYSVAISGEVVANVAADVKISLVSSIGLVDSAAHVQAALDGLEANAALISGITFSDATTPSLSVTASQLLNDADVLGKISSAYQLNVTGETAANVAADVKNSHVGSISVVDSAAHVQAALDSLEANAARIGGIVLTDQTTPSLTLGASQLLNDADVLGKISSAYQLNVTGETAANVAADVKNSHVTSIAVLDSAANVQANLNNLEGNAAWLGSITLSDSGTPTISLAAGQLLADAAVLSRIGSPYKLALTDTGTPTLALSASQFAPDAPLFARIGTPYKLALTDKGTPAIALTAAQFSQDALQLGKLSTPYSLTISGELATNVATDLKNSHVGSIGVVDSAAHVIASLVGLESSVGKLSGIVLTDSGTPTLAVSASQFSKAAAVFGKIGTPYSLAVSGETAANVATDVKNSHVASVAVVDSAAHVAASLGSLENNHGKLSGIVLSDKTTPALSLTAAQVTADLGALNTIQSSYLLSVKDSVADINGLVLGGVHTGRIEIMPTSLQGTLTENTQVTDLNLALIKLTGDSIVEKVYQVTGTEVDIVNSKGAVVDQLFFTNDTESQLHLVGVGSVPVHVMV